MNRSLTTRLDLGLLLALACSALLLTAPSAAYSIDKMQASSALAGEDFAGIMPAAFQFNPEFIENDVPGPLERELFPPPQPGPGGFAYTFVHVSDIQLRDRTRPPMQKLLGVIDPYQESGEANFYQDHGDVFYFGYMLRAIRAQVIADSARFVIHTGDAMHISRQTELEIYNRMITDLLLREGPDAMGGHDGSWLASPISKDGLPVSAYFDLLGNHDIFWLGNLRSPSPIRNTVPAGTPFAHEIQTWNTNYNRLRDQLRLLAKREADPDYFPADLPPHQMDAGPVQVAEPPDTARGYYHFEMDLPGAVGKKAVMITLNTNEPVLITQPIGAYAGAISPEQLEWLQELLAQADADPSVDHVIIFGHQRLKDITVARPGGTEVHEAGYLARLLAEQPKVIAYCRGHYHKGEIVEWDKTAEASALVEIGAPAVMEYPKPITAITVRAIGPGEWELSVRYVNLEDLIAGGAIDVTRLVEAGLVEPGPEQYKYATPYQELHTDESFKDLVRHLDETGLALPDRVLYLALMSINGADQDAHRIRASGYHEVDQHTFQEWREGPDHNQVNYEQPRLVRKGAVR